MCIGGSRGGMPGACPPMGPNSFIFAYICTEKCPCQRSTPPLTDAHPPMGNPGSATHVRCGQIIYPQPEQIHLSYGMCYNFSANPEAIFSLLWFIVKPFDMLTYPYHVCVVFCNLDTLCCNLKENSNNYYFMPTNKFFYYIDLTYTYTEAKYACIIVF